MNIQRLLRHAILLLAVLAGPLHAQERESPDALCWKMIEAAARNIHKPASPKRQDALQEAYVKVFERCLKASLNPDIMTPENYEAFIVRSANNLRISAFRKYDARNIGEIFEARQVSVRKEAGSPAIETGFLLLDDAEHSGVGEAITDEMAAAHLSVAIAASLTSAEIKTKLVRMAGVSLARMSEATGVPISTISGRSRSADAKLHEIFVEFEKFWTVDRAMNHAPRILFYALASALVFILGVGTVAMIRDALSATEHESESKAFHASQAEMKQKVALARKEAVLVSHAR